MLVIKNGVIVTPDGSAEGELWTDGGVIIEKPQNPVGAVEYDASGCLIFPGFTDAHVHLEMEAAGAVTADGFKSGTRAAVSGGTTAILDFATQKRGCSLNQALDARLEQAEGACACDYGFHMAVTDWTAAKPDIPGMADRGVASFKAYMAYDGLRMPDGDIRALLYECRDIGFVGAHCELAEEVERRTRGLIAAGMAAPRYHPLSRPNEVESLAVRRYLELAGEAGGGAWVVHLSTREGLEEIRAARKNGRRVLAETCPQYLTLTDSEYSRPGFEGAKYVCSPPLRGTEDCAALWEALGKGEVDIVSTDHCPFNFKGQKELGREDFSLIPGGLPGIEHRPVLMWSRGVLGGRISKERFCALLSENPARAFGMYPKKGALLPGSDADVVVWDPNHRWRISASGQTQNVDYTPWEGCEVSGRAKAVFLRGELVAENGAAAEKCRGRFIHRAAWR